MKRSTCIFVVFLFCIFFYTCNLYAAENLKEDFSGDEVAAVYNGKIFTVEDVKNLFNEDKKLSCCIMFDKAYPKLLERLLFESVVMEEIKREKKTDVDRQTRGEYEKKEIIDGYMDTAAYKSMTDESLISLYKEMYVPEEEAEIRAMLVKTKREAEDVKARIEAGENFRNVAREVSLEKAYNGKVFGPIPRGVYGKNYGNVEDVIFSGETNEKEVKIAESPDGFYVLQVVRINVIEPPAFENEKVRKEVEKEFISRKKEEIRKEFLSRAKVLLPGLK